MLSNTKGIVALFMYTLTGFPWACKMVIPYALIARTYKGDPDLGLFTATLNIALCFSQVNFANELVGVSEQHVTF